jgi:hypothetical protein
MYYIYHIPKRKEWGCTDNLNRRLSQLHYNISDLDRVITTPNIDIASDMERELNIQYGYKWNQSRYYKNVLSMHSDASRSKGGKIGGPIAGIKSGQIAKTTGQLEAARKLAFEKCNHSKYKCPHCDKEGQYRVMQRWHGDNCNSK